MSDTKNISKENLPLLKERMARREKMNLQEVLSDLRLALSGTVSTFAYREARGGKLLSCIEKAGNALAMMGEPHRELLRQCVNDIKSACERVAHLPKPIMSDRTELRDLLARFNAVIAPHLTKKDPS